MGDEGSVRVDLWIWSVRLLKTRSMATTACRAGHVRVNDERAKPSTAVKPGDTVRLRHDGRERIVVVQKIVRKRVGAPVAQECLIDKSPPPPPREALIPVGRRERRGPPDQARPPRAGAHPRPLPHPEQPTGRRLGHGERARTVPSAASASAAAFSARGA